jgi:hypothetical protein
MPCTESVHTEYSGQQGMVTLRYAECDSCGSEITGDADGLANKRVVLAFRSTIDCDPATGIPGLVCAQTSCEGLSTTDRNQPLHNPDRASA